MGEAEQKAEEAFQKKVANDRKTEEEKTAKRKRKRERAKEAKRRKKNMKRIGMGLSNNSSTAGNDAGEDEFEYTPIATSADGSKQLSKSEEDSALQTNELGQSINQDGASPFTNDGSFLERMKR